MKRLPLCGVIVALLLFSLAAGVCFAQQKVDLQYKFSAGETLNYLITMKGTTVTEFTGSPMPTQQMAMDGTIDFRQHVAEIDPNGVALLEMSCPGMNMNMSFAGQQMQMLWKNNQLSMTLNGQAQPAAGQDLSQMPFFGKPLKVRINEQGKMLDSPDLSALEGLTGNMDFGSLIKTSESQLPDHAVGIGDTWSVTIEVPIPGSEKGLQTKTHYKLVGFETLSGQRLARIQMKSTASAQNLTFQNPAQSGQTTINELIQDAQGTLWFSVDKGQLHKQDLTMTMQQKMSIPTSNGVQNVSMDMDMQMKMALK